jgi:hypothetical protein
VWMAIGYAFAALIMFILIRAAPDEAAGSC